MVAVLGANGAGKSSLLKALMGLEPAAEGRVTLDGADITRWPTEPAGAPASRAGAGGPPHRHEPDGARKSADGRVRPQGHARRSKPKSPKSTSGFRTSPRGGMLLASVLSGGEQQMLAIGRGLLSEPAS